MIKHIFKEEMKFFTGIGSRETPKDVLDIMRKVCKKMVLNGWTLRSGGADGADEYCAYGWGDAYSEDQTVPESLIYIPWDGFNGLYTGQKNVVLVEDRRAIDEARLLLQDIHPAYDRLTRGPLALHTRNCYQVLGSTLSVPSKTVLAYAKTDDKGNPRGGGVLLLQSTLLRNLTYQSETYILKKICRLY